MEPGAVRLARLASGSAPLLTSHRDYSVADVIGVIAKAWIEDGAGKALVRFSKRETSRPSGKTFRTASCATPRWASRFMRSRCDA